ncbi:MAG TPA: hypothetical protein PLS90_02240 [Candidatus Sumerlaeota bacterium]|nr:hypothetical protein [Candidatus Sumerlaeota bacterium]HOR26723.1 hypothetical protein [Candidatus Sumerlaeota bacterium]HPK01253.1 hypothetical protein [Candidatus Sumerlaeota bacterium]
MTAFLLTFGGFTFAMLAAFLVARGVTGWARALALRCGVISHVDHRSSHTRPTPRLGGLGLAAGFALPALGFLLLLWFIPHRGAAMGYHPAPLLWVGLGWLLMLAVGLVDDARNLPPLVKLALTALAALAPVAGGGVSFTFAQGFFFSTAAWSVALALLSAGWILFFTHGFNFMDGMDGFAANFARVAALGIFGVAFVPCLLSGNMNLLRAEAYLLPILAMACWGFLHWNRPPARVFMGDGGSLSTGYLLATWTVMGHRGMLGFPVPLPLALAILMPFLFDVLLTLARRLHRGENLLRAHREHLYQRLLRTGLGHGEVLRLNLPRFVGCAAPAVLTASLAAVLNSGWVRGRFGEGPIARIHAPFVLPALHLLALGAALLIMVQYWCMVRRREARSGAEEAAGG